jgi:hypothetical protein
MQRIRMSIPYFEHYGWEAEVVMVDSLYTDQQKDHLLLLSIPAHTKVHTVKAFPKKLTGKIGMGSLAWRCYWQYKIKVAELLNTYKYDLIYFSTTQFPVCALGAYWKKLFGIPYVIDMQDPWYSTYYKGKAKQAQSIKQKLNTQLHKYLESVAMNSVNGLISVSQAYINVIKENYPALKHIPSVSIPFGAFKPDTEIAITNARLFTNLLDSNFINLVYIGRGGTDLHRAIIPLFKALQIGLGNNSALYGKLKIYFIGTSYAPLGLGVPTIIPLAKQFGIANNVVEITDRISYYHTLLTLQQANALFIPGSDDPQYSASKIYPYLLTNKPLMAIFNPQSPVIDILAEYGAGYTYSFKDTAVEKQVNLFLVKLLNNKLSAPAYNHTAIQKYSAENLTKLQCQLFEQALK